MNASFAAGQAWAPSNCLCAGPPIASHLWHVREHGHGCRFAGCGLRGERRRGVFCRRLQVRRDLCKTTVGDRGCHRGSWTSLEPTASAAERRREGAKRGDSYRPHSVISGVGKSNELGLTPKVAGMMCCVLGRPLHRSTPWPACCRRRSGATLNLLPGPQSVSRDARPRRKSC